VLETFIIIIYHIIKRIGPTPLIKHVMNVSDSKMLRFVKSRDKCASFRIAYSRISILRSRNAFRKAFGQRRL